MITRKVIAFAFCHAVTLITPSALMCGLRKIVACVLFAKEKFTPLASEGDNKEDDVQQIPQLIRCLLLIPMTPLH
jgi:hypothetical protein